MHPSTDPKPPPAPRSPKNLPQRAAALQGAERRTLPPPPISPSSSPTPRETALRYARYFQQPRRIESFLIGGTFPRAIRAHTHAQFFSPFRLVALHFSTVVSSNWAHEFRRHPSFPRRDRCRFVDHRRRWQRRFRKNVGNRAKWRKGARSPPYDVSIVFRAVFFFFFSLPFLRFVRRIVEQRFLYHPES